MSSSIQRKHTTLSFCHLCNLLGKTGKTETRVSCTMMANHNSPIIEFRRCVIDTTIQIPQGDWNLRSFFKITRCRNGGKTRVGNSLGFWTQVTAGPFNFWYEHLVQASIKIMMTCIAGGPMPLPGKSPIASTVSSSSSSSSSSSCAVCRNGGSLANLALIAERWRSDILYHGGCWESDQLWCDRDSHIIKTFVYGHLSITFSTFNVQPSSRLCHSMPLQRLRRAVSILRYHMLSSPWTVLIIEVKPPIFL